MYPSVTYSINRYLDIAGSLGCFQSGLFGPGKPNQRCKKVWMLWALSELISFYRCAIFLKAK